MHLLRFWSASSALILPSAIGSDYMISSLHWNVQQCLLYFIAQHKKPLSPRSTFRLLHISLNFIEEGFYKESFFLQNCPSMRRSYQNQILIFFFISIALRSCLKFYRNEHKKSYQNMTAILCVSQEVLSLDDFERTTDSERKPKTHKC